MSKKPEALRLAHELEAYHNAPHHRLAAIELRRQHAKIERLMEALEIIAGYRPRIDRMGNQDVAEATLRREDV